MSKRSIIIVLISLIEGVIILYISYFYLQLTLDPTPASDQFQGFGIVFELVKPILFGLALIITVLFFVDYRFNKKIKNVTSNKMMTLGIIFGIIPTIIGIVFFTLNVGSGFYYNVQVQNIEISDLHDELLLSSQGNPMGIRLKFNAQFPSGNNYFMTYLLDEASAGLSSYSSLSFMQEYGRPVISPLPGEGGNFYVDGEDYIFVIDFIPQLYDYTSINDDGSKSWVVSYNAYPSSNPLVDNNTERCLHMSPFSKERFDQYNEDNNIIQKFRLEIRVDESLIIETQTEGFYSISKFHDGARMDSVLPC